MTQHAGYTHGPLRFSKTENIVRVMSTAVVTHLGRRFMVETYVDPYPGKASTERIEWVETCGRCGGSGVFTWWTSTGQASGTCFGCQGAGRVSRSRAVSMFRRDARLEALFREHGQQLADEAAATAEVAETARRAEEFERAWTAAHVEQGRRAALNNTPAGVEGERLRDLDASVTVSAGFERTGYTGYTEYVKIVAFTLETGQVLLCKGTASCLYDVSRGDRVKLTGTVCGTGMYHGQLQTVLQRPKVTVTERADAGDVGR
ncbi:Uncharacterised protein [Mycobacteroides abscessus subsp. massiliense]|nr:Uncharacterised protein [Mycobacteroides abscessus subsp. massiliense]